jgi:hypothetical protein
MSRPPVTIMRISDHELRVHCYRVRMSLRYPPCVFKHVATASSISFTQQSDAHALPFAAVAVTFAVFAIALPRFFPDLNFVIALLAAVAILSGVAAILLFSRKRSLTITPTQLTRAESNLFSSKSSTFNITNVHIGPAIVNTSHAASQIISHLHTKVWGVIVVFPDDSVWSLCLNADEAAVTEFLTNFPPDIKSSFFPGYIRVYAQR